MAGRQAGRLYTVIIVVILLSFIHHCHQAFRCARKHTRVCRPSLRSGRQTNQPGPLVRGTNIFRGRHKTRRQTQARRCHFCMFSSIVCVFFVVVSTFLHLVFTYIHNITHNDDDDDDDDDDVGDDDDIDRVLVAVALVVGKLFPNKLVLCPSNILRDKSRVTFLVISLLLLFAACMYKLSPSA